MPDCINRKVRSVSTFTTVLENYFKAVLWISAWRAPLGPSVCDPPVTPRVYIRRVYDRVGLCTEGIRPCIYTQGIWSCIYIRRVYVRLGVCNMREGEFNFDIRRATTIDSAYCASRPRYYRTRCIELVYIGIGHGHVLRTYSVHTESWTSMWLGAWRMYTWTWTWTHGVPEVYVTWCMENVHMDMDMDTRSHGRLCDSVRRACVHGHGHGQTESRTSMWLGAWSMCTWTWTWTHEVTDVYVTQCVEHVYMDMEKRSHGRLYDSVRGACVHVHGHGHTESRTFMWLGAWNIYTWTWTWTHGVTEWLGA